MWIDHSQNYELCWCKRKNINNLNKKIRFLKSEMYWMNQETMKEYQCVKYCSKYDLWHEISRFYWIKKETANSRKQSELLLLFKKFFDMSDCRAKCWILCFNNGYQECKFKKDVHC